MNYKYPLYQPDLTGNEKKYVNNCLDSTWISSKGKYIDLFERAFAKYLKVKYATSTCNGTVALHLALLALGIGPGDEIIVPTFTYVASVNAISYTGAKPIFVDPLLNTWQMNPKEVEGKITRRTRAIIAVHLYGHPCDMDALMNICKKHKLFLIEDSAEAIGSKYKKQYTGSFGDLATFSFFGNKTMTTGEGGMVVTNNRTLYDKVVHLKTQGVVKAGEYFHDIIGYNYRMTNICAAIGLAQLERIEEFLSKKRQIASWYKEFLNDNYCTFHNQSENIFHSYWVCSILVNRDKLRDSLRKYLASKGIETRPTFYPIHDLPMYKKDSKKFPVAEKLSRRGINLPSYPALKRDDIEYISRLINKYLSSHN